MGENNNEDYWLNDLEGMKCTVYFVYLGKNIEDPHLVNSKKSVTKKEKRKLYKYIINYLRDYCIKKRLYTDLFPDFKNCDKIVLFKGICINNNEWRNEITKIFGDLVLISNLKNITGDTEYYIKYNFEFEESETFQYRIIYQDLEEGNMSSENK